MKAERVTRPKEPLSSIHALQVSWPSRERPSRVTVDGKPVTDYTADGIRIAKPFKELVAQW